MEIGKQEDSSGLAEASDIVESLVSREVERGVSRSRVVVGGFSQGGAVALHYGFRCNEPLAGIVGLSTYLPLSGTFADSVTKSVIKTPVFLAHGLFDPVLMLALGESSRQVLEDNGCDVSWHTYSMPHTVMPEEVRDLSAWFNSRVWPDGS